MTRVNAKHPLCVEPAAAYLQQLSKSALIDIICDAMRRDKGDDISIMREADAKAFCEPVLLMRDDKVPDSTEDQLEKAKQKGRARTMFRNAKRIAGID